MKENVIERIQSCLRVLNKEALEIQDEYILVYTSSSRVTRDNNGCVLATILRKVMGLLRAGFATVNIYFVLMFLQNRKIFFRFLRLRF
jgi:hypothetical protein